MPAEVDRLEVVPCLWLNGNAECEQPVVLVGVERVAHVALLAAHALGPRAALAVML